MERRITWWTTARTAKELGISVGSVVHAIHRGSLPAKVNDKGHYEVPHAAVKAYQRRHAMGKYAEKADRMQEFLRWDIPGLRVAYTKDGLPYLVYDPPQMRAKTIQRANHSAAYDGRQLSAQRRQEIQQRRDAMRRAFERTT